MKHDRYNNKWVIIRSCGSGVHFGEVESYDAETCHVYLKNSRRLHYWLGFTLSAVALNGMKKHPDARVSITIPEILISCVVEIIPCSDRAIESLKNYTLWVTKNDIHQKITSDDCG